MFKSIKVIVCMTILVASSSMYSQKKQSKKMTNQETVITFLNGFNDPSKIQESLDLLADDYKFKNPMVSLNSKKEFIVLAKEIGAVLTGINIIRVSENGEWVATYYEFTSSILGLESTYGSEWFRLENGIIKESHLIYDTSKWQEVYAQMKN